MMAWALDDPQPGRASRPACRWAGSATPMTWPATVIFLSSRAGRYLTGTVIPVDGGITMAAR